MATLPPRQMEQPLDGIQERSTTASLSRSSLVGEPPWASAHLLGAQLPLQHREPMAQREDLYILVAFAHRQQTQEGERIRDTQVRQSQQRGRPSCRGKHPALRRPTPATGAES